MTKKKNLTAAERKRIRSEAGRKGGLAKLKKYGRKHFSEMGKKGIRAACRNPGLMVAVPCPTPGYKGAPCGNLVTTEGVETSCYGVWPAASLKPSHNPKTWEPNPEYPKEVQERDYKGNKRERLKVERIAKKIDADLVLNNSPEPITGPPIVSGSGIVLGGNGRTMALQLAYGRKTAAWYRSELVKRAPMFGLTAEQVKKVKDPILVRVVPRLDAASSGELAAASSRFNEGLTAALDERTQAVALARRLSPQTLATVSNLLDEYGTLREAMARAGADFVRVYRGDDLITDASSAAYVDNEGGLTEAGKQRVEGSYLGLVVGTPERLAQATPATLQRIERLTPYLARVQARNPEHDVVEVFQKGMDLLHSAEVAKMTPTEFAGQQDFTRGPVDLRAVAAAEMLLLPQKKLQKAADSWLAVANFDPNQASLFGKTASPEDTWAAFTIAALGHKKAEQLEKKIVQQLEQGASVQTPGQSEGLPTIQVPMSDQEFADTLLPIVAGIQGSGRFGDGNKVFIHAAYLEWPDKNLSEEAFKERLATANQKRNVTLTRADLVEAMDKDMVAASHMKPWPGAMADFHFIVDPSVKE